MPQKNLQVRLDEKLKRKAEAVFKKVGLDTPTAIRAFFSKVAITGRIPFSLSEDIDYYTPAELKALDRIAARAKKGIGVSRAFSSMEEMLEDLHKKL